MNPCSWNIKHWTLKHWTLMFSKWIHNFLLKHWHEHFIHIMRHQLSVLLRKPSSSWSWELPAPHCGRTGSLEAPHRWWIFNSMKIISKNLLNKKKSPLQFFLLPCRNSLQQLLLIPRPLTRDHFQFKIFSIFVCVLTLDISGMPFPCLYVWVPIFSSIGSVKK